MRHMGRRWPFRHRFLTRRGVDQIAGGAVPVRYCPGWVKRLNDAGIGAQRALPDVSEFLDDPWVIAHGLGVTRGHDEIGLVPGFGLSSRLARTPVAIGRPAPKPGAQGREILEELGLGHQFDRLVEQGVILTDGVAAG